MLSKLQEIKNTKKEWEVQLQQAKERESARVRPSTSLGLPSSFQLSKPENLMAAAATQSVSKVSSSGAYPQDDSEVARECDEASHDHAGKDARSRQIHTSAGFRNGPEEHLLRQAAVHPFATTEDRAQEAHRTASSNTADILTL